MDFGVALKNLKQGKQVTRDGWSNSRRRVVLQKPDKNSKMKLPYFYTYTLSDDSSPANEDLVPWVPQHEDILAHDWRLVR